MAMISTTTAVCSQEEPVVDGEYHGRYDALKVTLLFEALFFCVRFLYFHGWNRKFFVEYLSLIPAVLLYALGDQFGSAADKNALG